MKAIKIFTICLASFVFAYLFRHSLSFLDTDLGWHLKTGQDILINHQAPQKQFYMWTIPEATWVDHEWLTNIVMYLVYANFNYIGLAILFAALGAGLSYLLIDFIVKRFPLSAVGFFTFWLIGGFFGMMPHLGVRAQLLSIFFLAIEFIIIEKYQTSRQTKKLWTLLPLFLLWANLHAGFLIGLTVLFIYTVFDLVTSKNLSLKFIWDKAKWPSGAALITLVNPYGLGLYAFLWEYKNTAYLKILNEWQPLYAEPLMYRQLIMLGVTMAIVIAIFIFDEKRKQTFKPAEIVTLLLLAGMAIKSIRHFPLLFIAATFIIIPKFLAVNSSEQPAVAKKSLTKKYLYAISLVLVLLTGGLLYKTTYVKNPFNYFCQNNPCGSVTYLKNRPDLNNKRFLNHYNFGSYLIWQWPEKKIYIDGRMPQHILYDKTSMIEDFMEYENPTKLAAKLINNKIEVILWKKTIPKTEKNVDAQLNKKDKSPLLNFLETNTQWEKIFEDSASVIYLKKPAT